jgi:L-ascorbate metabolism protein UlaG (beta-lactamase superfamily)
VPVGAGPTIGADQAAAIVERLSPRWVVPMHYRTHRLNFLELPDEFLQHMPRVESLTGTGFDTGSIAGDGRPIAVVPAVP